MVIATPIASSIPLMTVKGIAPQLLGGGYLDTVLASTVFELDATQALSYSGSGTTWSNLTNLPADGAAKTDYDFRFGDGSTGTTYPTFNGSAGSQAAYWSFDGGDYFTTKNISTPNTFLGNTHKTTGGTSWWIAIAFNNTTSGFWTGSSGLFGTADNSAVPNSAGIFLRTDAARRIDLVQNNGAGFVTKTQVGTFGSGTGDKIAIFSRNASTNKIKFWVNSATGETEINETWGASSAAGTRRPAIGAYAGGGNPMPSHLRIYSFAMGNAYLTDANAAALIANWETRHGRDYTP